MDYLNALLALGAVALPLVAVWGLMEWQARRRARVQAKRGSHDS
ncbi:hypothetical protein [Roseateles sp.]|nr:hypothetical protein [Roseateles sp.]